VPRINTNPASELGQSKSEKAQSRTRKKEEKFIRRFCFEISATIGFAVHAKSEDEARQKAESCKARINENGVCRLPLEHEAYVVVGDLLDLIDE
jgi:hypothetical protein